jgi:hypothetical protein
MVRESRLNIVIRCTPGDYTQELFDKLNKRFTGLKLAERYESWIDGFGWLVVGADAHLINSIEAELEAEGSVFEYNVRRIPEPVTAPREKRK